MRLRPIIPILALFASLAWAAPEDVAVDAMRGPVAIPDATQPPLLRNAVNDDVRKPRNYEWQPPIIPHRVDGYQIDKNFNKCLDCHARGKTAFSQASQSSIQGTLTDQTGGVIPGAMVTVVDVARGGTRSLTTDGAGQYVAPSVIPGTYTVRAEAAGFSKMERTGVIVEVGQNVRVDLALRAGEQTQTVTVTEEIPFINTTDSQLGGTVTNQQLNQLPFAERSPIG